MIQFAVPQALMLLACALPVIFLYILKVRLRRVPVSTNLFWKQIYDEKPPRSIWQYLRHLLSLLLQLALLLLLALSVCDPYFATQLLRARRIVAVVNNSASMRSADVAPTRLEASRRTGHQWISSLRFRDQMAIVLAGERPDVIVGMTDHEPTLHRALDSIAASDNPTRIEPAMTLARQLIGSHPHGEIVVLTDGCDATLGETIDEKSKSLPATAATTTSTLSTLTASGATRAAPSRDESSGSTNESSSAQDPSIRVSYQIAASQAANIGIVQFQARRSYADPLGYDILLAVKNAGDATVTGRVELELNGSPIDVIPLELKANETWQRSLSKTSREGGQLTAMLTRLQLAQTSLADSEQTANVPTPPVAKDIPKETAPSTTLFSINHLAVDDRAWAIVPERKIRRVLLVTPGNLFLQKVLEANPLVALETQASLPDTWPTDRVIILHQTVPEKIPEQDVWIVDPRTDCDLWTLNLTNEPPIITDQDSNSPLMRHVRLDNVVLPQSRRLEASVPVHILAGSVEKEVIFGQLQRSRGRCLILNVDLEESDLAFRTAFPILASNVLSWYAGDTAEVQPAWSTGQFASLDLNSLKLPSNFPSTLQKTANDKPDANATAQHVPDVWHLVSPGKEWKRLVWPESKAPPASEEESSGKPSPAIEPQAAPKAMSEPVQTLLVGPFDQTGLWSIERSQAPRESSAESLPTSNSMPRATLAVNLSSGEETDLRPHPRWLEMTPATHTLGSWLTRPIWIYLTLLACGLAVIEWWLYQRRILG